MCLKRLSSQSTDLPNVVVADVDAQVVQGKVDGGDAVVQRHDAQLARPEADQLAPGGRQARME